MEENVPTIPAPPDTEVKKVSSKCKRCGKIEDFEVPATALRKRMRGMHIDRAMPDVPEHIRRQLTEQLCFGCQRPE